MAGHPARKLNNDTSALDDLKRAEQLAKEMQQIHGDFASTLVAHMKRLDLTNEIVAEGADISMRSVTDYRNKKDAPITFLTVIALCISMHLAPDHSDDLIRKAGYVWRATPRDMFLREMLRKYYRKDIFWWNEQLEAAGFKDRLPGK